VAIISFRLAGMDHMGDTAQGVYEHVHPYLQGNVVLFCMEFDFTKPSKSASVPTFCSMLSPWPCSITRFLVFLTSHSDPVTGDIHVQPENRGASTFLNVLAVLIPKPLQTILRRGGCASSNILVILACGSAVTAANAKSQVQEFAKQDLFQEIVSFKQQRLQYTYTHSFLNDAALSFYVYGRTPFARAVLPGHNTLGGHTAVISFTSSHTYQYLWSHPTIRPFGIHVSKQCRACHRVPGFSKCRIDPESHKAPQFHKALYRVCNGCGDKQLHTCPKDGEWLGPNPAANSAGDWLRVPY
ncbi:hypothetical protein FA13DRAFT_1640702, partial [Coprinellus micaceus]